LIFKNKIDLNGTTRTIAVNKTSSTANGATIDSVIRDSQSAGAGLIKTGPGRLILTGANTYTGGVTINGGILQAGNATALGTSAGALSFGGAGATLDLRISPLTVSALSSSGAGYGLITSGTSGARALTVNQSADTTYSGIIENGSGEFALTKTGTGTLTLSGANTYTGATAVNNGTLQVNGSLTSAVTISSGATLAGTGTITGNVGVPSGATLQPGSPDGTLTITGDATVGGTLAITLDGNGNAVDVSGELDITGGSLEVTGTTSSAIRVIATYGTLTGDFGSNLTLPSGWVVNYTYEGNKIALTGPSGTIFRFR